MGVTVIVLRIVLQVCRIVLHGGIMWKLVCCNVRRFCGQILWRPQGDSNPRFRRERPMSWATRRWGHAAILNCGMPSYQDNF